MIGSVRADVLSVILLLAVVGAAFCALCALAEALEWIDRSGRLDEAYCAFLAFRSRARISFQDWRWGRVQRRIQRQWQRDVYRQTGHFRDGGGIMR